MSKRRPMTEADIDRIEQQLYAAQHSYTTEGVELDVAMEYLREQKTVKSQISRQYNKIIRQTRNGGGG